MYTLYNQTDVTNLQEALDKLKCLADELKAGKERERSLQDIIDAQTKRELQRLEAYTQGKHAGYRKAQQDFFVKRNGGGY